MLGVCKRGLAVTLLLFASCSSRDPKFQQYFVQGERLYVKHCSNCHQKDGKGLGLVYPPLDSSDFMTNQFEQVICLMRNGKSGELFVNGKSFNLPMPGVPALTDLEIAELTTYIYNVGYNHRGLVPVQEVTSVLDVCK